MKKFIALASIAMLSVTTFGVVNAQSGYGYGTTGTMFGGGGGGSGGGGSSASSLQRDFCPDGDETFSFYDGLCADGVAAETSNEGTTTTPTGTTTPSTTTTTTTGTTGGNVTVVTTTTSTPGATAPTTTGNSATTGGMVDEEAAANVMSIKERLAQNNANAGSTAPVVQQISLPSFLPETGASL